MGASSFRSVVIVNPQSAGGRTRAHWPTLSRMLDAVLPDREEYLTTQPCEAEVLARQAALRPEVEMVVAVGGDGTLHEVINGCAENARMLRQDLVLGVLTSGTGSDFRRSLGQARNPEQVIATLGGRDTVPLDLGACEFRAHSGATVTRVFLNIADFGMGGEVVSRVNRSSKRLGGRLTFLKATLQTLATFRNAPVTLTIDGEPPKSATVKNVVVANGRFFGSGMAIAPAARIADGALDLVLIGDIGPLATMWRLRRLYRANAGQPAPGLSWRRIHRLEAAGERALLLDLDGEQPGTLPARFWVLPSAMRLKISADRAWHALETR